MTSVSDIRWQQRFKNFQRAFLLLREAVESDIASFSQLEKEGVIQRFEYTFELAWKVLKDKMEFDGIILDQISPKSVVRQAYQSKYINDAETWLRMIGDRNLMSHTYDFSKFEQVIDSIKISYLPMLDEWYTSLLEEIVSS
ncbi:MULTISPECIES: nucleotidyltransferase substrate binding protein [unclassified Oleiphilus]|uniref:nucleotidyltransferase substrate binding protein n=1 Tax=unclassified Oleiphilus TaxID=2631174 RepID=UPI0007C31275|nr:MULTISPECIES: nucleotidyltransferase substrate binding protein [unclassified Oleiphilus]KZY45271.1 nucleotidyltransferase [Oleiphilus sp. HI0050]KZY94973.1 nucleotidyltransferase [Oleiphilus sp. HI0072]KZZ25546.1 nucleotidyltransferase [Oleiphilus sp. HI0081]KZY60736.1 nucleotidyltransferase [Oleiphilus sp. HI0061]KZY97403.1 nucleotidyltransferase [Oleiphilus sp. HI0072]